MTHTDPSDDLVVTRSEERLRVDVLRVPVRRAIIRKVIVEEVRTVTVRHEELQVDYEDVDVADISLIPTDPVAPLEIVLHEEQLAAVVVPTERVRVLVDRVGGEQRFSGSVQVERIEVDGRPLTDDDRSAGRHRA